MDAPAPSSIAQVVREELRREAPARERHIALFMAALCGLLGGTGLASGLVVGWRQALPLAAFALLGAAYYAVLAVAIRRGFFHPAISWINAAVEVSAPALLFLADAFREGPHYAMSAPALAIWPVLVMATSLRANRLLAYAAGALAGVEFLLVYFLKIRPELPPDYPRSLIPLFAVLRGFFLFYAGAATAAVASLLLRKSEDAIRNLREKDLMGKYLLQERIGAGGMAEVFKARYCPEGGFERVVAVKRVLPAYAQDAEFLRLFREEARLGALLNHPNIVQVLDVGRHQGSYYLAMEWVDGLTLEGLIARLGRPLPLPAVSWIALQLAGALDYAHHRTSATGEPLRLVHRDLNPPNVLVSRIGEVKLTDFGIARAADRVRLTSAGIVRGKSCYLSPEQARDLDIDARSDLFALGLTLWEALAGRRAVVAEKDEQALLKLILEDVPPASSVRPDVPAALDAILRGLLARDRDGRTESAKALQGQLEALQGSAAPFPDGRRLLVDAVAEALARDPLELSLESGPFEAPTERLVAGQ